MYLKVRWGNIPKSSIVQVENTEEYSTSILSYVLVILSYTLFRNCAASELYIFAFFSKIKYEEYPEHKNLKKQIQKKTERKTERTREETEKGNKASAKQSRRDYVNPY